MQTKIAQPLISYRVWKIEDSLLTSIHADCIWYPGKVVKQTNKFMGIHSWKTLKDAADCMVEHYFHHNLCVGEIYNWGKIREFSKGYQSKFAYPKKLYVFNNLPLAQEFHRKYGCEVENINLNLVEKFLHKINYIFWQGESWMVYGEKYAQKFEKKLLKLHATD